jgi:LysM domain
LTPGEPPLHRRTQRSALESGWLAGLLGLLLVGLIAAIAIVPGLGIQITIAPIGATATVGAAASEAPVSAAPSVSPTFSRPTPTIQPSPLQYVVKSGDTLLGLGKRYETTGRSIAFWNRDRYPTLDPDSPRYNPNDLQVGWILAITPGIVVDESTLPGPSGSGYPVAPGTSPVASS